VRNIQLGSEGFFDLHFIYYIVKFSIDAGSTKFFG
jgi:hypothetical protein